ncbi:MAG: RNA 2',3'-cyclic phosphodiesterase [Nocardioidaceae bacterium]|nr:RNA 2',3'-cyclic phosphodiesterase [Nocardioidaceae bacterium]MCL2614381.1 RNA 2',3'-cyclic phosphodiesterase [Nocardioidaceae bacterium]
MTARLFAAVMPPRHAIEHLDTFLEPRRAAAGDDLRWSDTAQAHVTLAFMAAVEDRRVDEYVDRLADGLTGIEHAELRLAGPVIFPDPAAARVLATGVAGGGVVLPRLAERARNAAVVSGIAVDGGRFRPHVTLARLRRPTDVTSWVRLLETYDGPPWLLTEVAVIASHLGEGPRGTPRHEVVAEIVIAG